jgi:hypothetical protein
MLIVEDGDAGSPAIADVVADNDPEELSEAVIA